MLLDGPLKDVLGVPDVLDLFVDVEGGGEEVAEPGEESVLEGVLEVLGHVALDLPDERIIVLEVEVYTMSSLGLIDVLTVQFCLESLARHNPPQDVKDRDVEELVHPDVGVGVALLGQCGHDLLGLVGDDRAHRGLAEAELCASNNLRSKQQLEAAAVATKTTIATTT